MASGTMKMTMEMEVEMEMGNLKMSKTKITTVGEEQFLSKIFHHIKTKYQIS